MRIHDPKLRNMAHALSLSVFIAFEEVNFYICIIHFLVICKFENDRINSNREKMDILIFRRSRAANSIVSK